MPHAAVCNILLSLFTGPAVRAGGGGGGHEGGQVAHLAEPLLDVLHVHHHTVLE